MQDSEKPVVFYNWSASFAEFFKKLPNIKKYHHFKMMAQVPGVVHVKEYTHTEESEINIMKSGQIQIDSETLPDTIIPKGLDAAGTSMMKSDHNVKTLPKLLHHAVNRHLQNLAKESNVRQTRESVQRSLLNQKLKY